MSTRSATLILAGTLALAPPALAQEDRAVPRGGGSPSGGGSHPSPGVQSSGSGSHSSPGVSHPSGPGPSSPSTAERRHPRAGSGRGGGYHPGRPVYPGYPGWGGGYYPWWGWSYWWPYSGWYGSYWGGYWSYPWSWGGVTVYNHRTELEPASVRVLVDPAEARVYVDGYYAGTVDDFDGLFQRLRLSPGRHEISFKLEGYQTHRVKVYVTPNRTLKLSHEMQRGQGETFEDLVGDLPDREARREREPEPPRDELTLGEGRPEDAAPGRLRLFVEPEDASVYVDGAFRGTGRGAASISLAPGRHRLEVVRPGYRTEERDVEIGPGEPAEITVTLARAPI